LVPNSFVAIFYFLEKEVPQLGSKIILTPGAVLKFGSLTLAEAIPWGFKIIFDIPYFK